MVPYQTRLKTNKPENREYLEILLKNKPFIKNIWNTLNDVASKKEQRILAKELIHLGRLIKKATDP